MLGGVLSLYTSAVFESENKQPVVAVTGPILFGTFPNWELLSHRGRIPYSIALEYSPRWPRTLKTLAFGPGSAFPLRICGRARS